MKPVISQTAMSQPALPTLRVISALTMNMPDPIIEPATIMVASQSPKLGLNEVVFSAINSFNGYQDT
jgi:hypothetical protein